MRAKAIIAVFLLLLGGFAALNLFSPDRAFSENENRYLKQRPAFSTTTLLSGELMADYDEYVTDQFVGRDAWVGVKTLAEKAAGKRESGGIYFAQDGYLIERFDEVNREQFDKNLVYVRDFARWMEAEQGVTVEAMLVPTASHILAEKLPGYAPELNQGELLARAEEVLDSRLVDVSGVLTAHSDKYIYYRTDHHWTSLGAYYAYSGWREGDGLPAHPLENYQQKVLSEEFYGTTYSKASLYTTRPDTMLAFVPQGLGEVVVNYNRGEEVTDTIYQLSHLKGKDKYSAYLNANQSITKITTGRPGGKLLVIKDSFANTFVQFLLEDYREIVVVDLRYYKTSVAELVAEEGIDRVLVLYNLKGFSEDRDLYFLVRDLNKPSK